MIEKTFNPRAGEGVSALYFIKDTKGNRIPFMFSETSLSVLFEDITDETWVQKIQKDFPFSKGNLFVMVNGMEFKIDHSDLDIHPITD